MTLDLTGQKVGRLLVVERTPRRDKRNGLLTYYTCLCDCGKTVSVRQGSLRSGTSTSCGCQHKEILAARSLNKTTKKRTYRRRAQARTITIHDKDTGRILMADENGVYAIQCFANGKRKLTDELTKEDALVFRNAALHLTRYLNERYDLPNPMGRPLSDDAERRVHIVSPTVNIKG